MQTATSELARLGELIDSIYQGATDPNHWNIALPAIAEWVGSPQSLLLTPLHSPNDGGFYFNYGIPEHFLQLWATKYHSKDVWSAGAIAKGQLYEGNVIISDEVVTFDELSQSEFYQDFLSKHDVAHLLSGIIFGGGTQASKEIPTVVCSFYRGISPGVFTVAEQERLRLLVPHISRSVGVMTKLRDMELKIVSGLSALERLSSGVLLFDERGVVVFANRAAKRILDEEDGLKLRHLTGSSTLGEVVTESNKTQAELNQAIRSAVSPDVMDMAHFSRAVMVSRPSGRQEYMLNFSSLAAQNEFGSGSDTPRAIAFITDHAEPIRLDAELLRNTYGLTPAEVRLTETIAEGLTVDEAADCLGVSRHTVKSQLQSVYGKTNTNNRAKLMRLIMSLAQIAD